MLLLPPPSPHFVFVVHTSIAGTTDRPIMALAKRRANKSVNDALIMFLYPFTRNKFK